MLKNTFNKIIKKLFNKESDFSSFFIFPNFKSFKNKILNNKSYLYFKDNNEFEFLPEIYRNLFVDKIKSKIPVIDLNYNENSIIQGKKKDDIYLLWIYYSKIFTPMLKQENGKIIYKKDVSKVSQYDHIDDNRYFYYDNYFLDKNKENEKNFLMSNKMGVFDFLMLKQAVYLQDYSNDYLLGTHKILIDISTDTIVSESLEKYSKNEIRVRSKLHLESKDNRNIRLNLRNFLKESITFSDKSNVDEYFFVKIKKLNHRREKLINYYLKNQNEKGTSKLYFDYTNNLIFILGRKIKVIFLIRQIYFSKDFKKNFKYLLILRKKLINILKEEKITRKKMLILKRKKNRVKIHNVIEKEDFFFYKRRYNFLKFNSIMERKKKGKYSRFFFSSITDFSIFVDVDGSKYFNSYLKYPFKNTIDEEIDLNDYIRDTNYNLNYMNVSDAVENDVVSYYIDKNYSIREFLKGLMNYNYTTYNYALPIKMEGDVLEFEALTKKLLKENRKLKEDSNNLNKHLKKILDNNSLLENQKHNMIFDFNDYIFNVLHKNKNNLLTFSNKDFSLDNSTSMFFEFFIFGHLMFKLLSLNQKFNIHFCFNYLSKNYLNNNEYISTLKNNTLVSRFSKNKKTVKTQYIILLKNKIWFHFPLIKKFYYTYFISFFRFLFSGVLPSFLIKTNGIFYIICKVYLYIIDTTFAQFIILVPINTIKQAIFIPFLKKTIKFLNLPYSYDDFIKFSYTIQRYMRVPGYSMTDINNFLSYYIASPYVYYYEITLKFLITNIFLIFDFIVSLF